MGDPAATSVGASTRRPAIQTSDATLAGSTSHPFGRRLNTHDRSSIAGLSSLTSQTGCRPMRTTPPIKSTLRRA
jgi:hypothetical protein